MRTTLILEERIVGDLKRIAQTSGKAFEVVVSETLQAGLTRGGAARAKTLPAPSDVVRQRTDCEMTKSSSMSAYEIRLEGWKALTERLGPAGAMRFMMRYDLGHGDYTKERHEIFADLELEDLLSSIREKKGSADDR
jgi:hypothetical protein